MKMKFLNKLKLNSNGFGHHIILPIIVVAAITAVGIRVIIASHAAVSIAPAGTYTFINMPSSNYTNITNDIKINSVSNLGNTPYFWSHQFYFMGGPTGQGAYFGIQGINRALFSVFDYASPQASSYCSVVKAGFDGGNEPGTSCIISYKVTQGHTYHLKVSKISSNSLGNNWQATVEDETTGVTTNIATINVASSWGNIASSSIVWTEYFGSSISSCSSLPLSNVTFSKFTAANGKYTAPASHSDSITQNACTPNSKIIDNSSNSFTHEMGI